MKPTLCTLLILLANLCLAQVNYNANSYVPDYEGDFYFGTNMGYYGSQWQDEMLADIAAGNNQMNQDGIGVKTIRIALYHHFLEEYGYNIRLSTAQHYASLGIKDITAFIGYPSNDYRDWSQHCPGQYSETFSNLYMDIWDNGENGTPINENNFYAAYVYKTVSVYKDYIKFWEIWNEPDLDLQGNGWKPVGNDGNWWENNPGPCETALRAPIFQYIRMLRISYEIIKTLDPTAYVAVGGLGYPSYLDAILRNSDNPAAGQLSTEYPLRGGAYFDVLSYHSYPHIDGSLKEWNNDNQNFDYHRHSDRAAEGFISKQEEFLQVLKNYGYNGITRPNKICISTETNIPRQEFGDYIGSEEAQKNYVMKAIVQALKNDIRQLYFYNLGEASSYDFQNENEFYYMGLYNRLENIQPYTQEKTAAGIGFKSSSILLEGYEYNHEKTLELNIPNNIGGGAFENHGDFVYVLWAKTSEDKNENSIAFYNFPSALNIDELNVKFWDYSVTGEVYTISSQNVALRSTPAFFVESQSALPVELLAFTGYKNGSDVDLVWVTDNEENSDKFVIEHSVNNSDFSEIGTLSGAGNSQDIQTYKLTHEHPVRGNNYYRLTQIDFDGTIHVGPIVSVDIEVEDIFVVRPNLVHDEFFVEFYEYYNKPVELYLFDAFGQLIMEKQLIQGSNAITFDLTDFPTGQYFLKLKLQGEGYFTKKIIKMQE